MLDFVGKYQDYGDKINQVFINMLNIYIQNYQIFFLQENPGFYVDHFSRTSLMDESLPGKKRREFLDCWRASKIDTLHFSRDVKRVFCFSSAIEANKLETLKPTKNCI